MGWWVWFGARGEAGGLGWRLCGGEHKEGLEKSWMRVPAVRRGGEIKFPRLASFRRCSLLSTPPSTTVVSASIPQPTVVSVIPGIVYGGESGVNKHVESAFVAHQETSGGLYVH